MEIKLPDIGEGVHEGEIVRWLVKEGDAIKVDQPLIEIMTDKATLEIPSPHAGTVKKVYGKEGDVIKVGQPVVSLSEEGASAGASKSAPSTVPMRASYAGAAGQAAQAPGQTYAASPGNVLATPATRRLARDMGVDLGQVPASGPAGRVTKEDLQRFIGASAAGPQVPAPHGMRRREPMPAQAKTPAAPKPSPLKPSPLMPGQRETLIPFRGIRKKIAEGMTKSRGTIPEFTYVDECDVTELVQFRAAAKGVAEKEGVKLTYLPFIVKAVIKGLKEFPYMNSQLDEQNGNVVLKNYYNIGIAVDTEQGLIVPVVKDADKKSILEIARDVQVLAEKARAGKLALEDMKDGTFTITNAGTIGGMLATPIINWPEVAILGVHKISKRPVVKTINGRDEIVPADVLWLSVAIDHRVVDGAMGARFLNVVMEQISNLKLMFLDAIRL
ncbi:MAG: 2-oxo acid dehydrogenase subunit E2 [Deltaproteobacteria bacterium]|nr:2-oxo acid dehydrogenase subunit E2 [Deltaproteobacteria bacterium]